MSIRQLRRIHKAKSHLNKPFINLNQYNRFVASANPLKWQQKKPKEKVFEKKIIIIIKT